MTVKEYLKQARYLDHQISCHMMEAAELRILATSVPSPRMTERVAESRNGSASFTGYVEKIIALEEKINAKIDMFIDLKAQIHDVIASVEKQDERMVLEYRYIHGYTWERIGDKLCVDARTVRRWHGNALRHVVLPENPIKV